MKKESDNGNIPTIAFYGRTLPEVWEKAIIGIWEQGADIRTEYDRKDASGAYLDPPSKDITGIIEVTEPFGEPRIHKNFPGGPEELEIYRQEVVEGIHDHWVDPTDPTKWTYTYHGRLFNYQLTADIKDPKAIFKVVEESGKIREVIPVDQMKYVIQKIAKTPDTRRVQAITWMPTADPQTDDPPCLQRLWFRGLRNKEGQLVLNMNSHWRSRDAYKAWFMNAFALTDLMKWVAEQVGKVRGEKVLVGRYTDISDSLHIYGSYFKDFEPEYKKMKANPDYTTRSWESEHPAVKFMFEETRRKLADDPDYMKSK